MPMFNSLPVYPTPLIQRGFTNKDWYFFLVGLFKRIAPGNIEAITPGASPYVFTTDVGGNVIIQGGTVSLVQFSRDGVTYIATGVTQGFFPLNASDFLRVTYTVAPNMTFVPT